MYFILSWSHGKYLFVVLGAQSTGFETLCVLCFNTTVVVLQTMHLAWPKWHPYSCIDTHTHHRLTCPIVFWRYMCMVLFMTHVWHPFSVKQRLTVSVYIRFQSTRNVVLSTVRVYSLNCSSALLHHAKYWRKQETVVCWPCYCRHFWWVMFDTICLKHRTRFVKNIIWGSIYIDTQSRFVLHHVTRIILRLFFRTVQTSFFSRCFPYFNTDFS